MLNMAPTKDKPATVKFADQSPDERYRLLVQRLKAKADDWRSRRDDFRSNAEAADNEDPPRHGAAQGLKAKANAIDTCIVDLEAIINRHVVALGL